MKATITVRASNLEEAREKAMAELKDFFGDTPFQCSDERSVPGVELAQGGVVSWTCEFTAEEAA